MSPRSFSLAVKQFSGSYSRPVHLLVLISNRTARVEKLRVSLMTETDRAPVWMPLTFPGWAEDRAGRDAISVGTRSPLRRKKGEGNKHVPTRTHAHSLEYTCRFMQTYSRERDNLRFARLEVIQNKRSGTQKTLQDLIWYTAVNHTLEQTPHRHTHTHKQSRCKWALQRLHGMWLLPSASAHILFPDPTRARLLGNQHELPKENKKIPNASLLFFSPSTKTVQSGVSVPALLISFAPTHCWSPLWMRAQATSVIFWFTSKPAHPR